MITKDYKQNKEQVLSLFEEYKNLCNKLEKKPNESIVEQAKKIKDEIFNLMILGEAKSGKSTFINAYLGKEVVPMDVRQCTSAIIKIKKGDKFELVATSAAGGKATVSGYEKIKEFLKNHAAISDKYRNIPLTTINNEILIKYKGKEVRKQILESFLEEELKDNIFNIEEKEYKKLIKAYIAENRDNWGKIITEIEITYPLPEAMKGITIIDSPGVGAGGNVGKIAEDYIKDANAIIFVKSLSGQALESTSFMNFLRNNCTSRKKESLFLIFTGKSNLQGSEFNSLKEQALAMYGNDINREKIIFVDSKMQLFLNTCMNLGTVDAINEYFDELERNENDYPPASNCWFKARGDINKFEEKMGESSNFNSVQNAIEKFARVANYIQLIEFLENLEKEYLHYKAIYKDMLKTAQEYINDPIALEDSIRAKKKEIADVYNKLNKGISQIYQDYTDNINGEGIIMNEADKMQSEYEGKLENFRKLSEGQISNTTFSSMKKMTMDAIDDTKAFRREMADRVIKDCNEKLIQFTDNPDSIPADAYNPNFTETDFDKIDEKAKEKTSGVEEVEAGLTFTRTERVPYHHLKEHVKLVADSIYKRLDTDIIPKMKSNVISYVENCIEVYKKKLLEHKKELDVEYGNLLADQSKNENAQKTVDELRGKCEIVSLGLEMIESLKGELKNYVG